MLKHTKLLIDRDCPMCHLYGACFTRLGLVDKHTVTPYQTARTNVTSKIDMDRARNEIALYDQAADFTLYGIDALIRIISHCKPRLKWLLRSILVYPILLRMYRFISYNRKVIYPSVSRTGMRQCIPDPDQKYRWAYIITTALFTGFILSKFSLFINNYTGLPHLPGIEYFICLGQILWQGAMLSTISDIKTLRLDYLGNMSTISVIGTLLILIASGIQSIIDFSLIISAGTMGIVVVLVLVEHIRRCWILRLPVTLTLSWAIYWIVVFNFLTG